MSYRTYYFYFTQVTDKKSQFSFKNWWFTTFTTFSLHWWSSLEADFGISSGYVMSEMKRSFCFWNIPGSGGLNRKNTWEKVKFWPLIPWGTGFPIHGSRVQNHWVAPRLTQPSEVNKMNTKNFWELSGKR